MILVDDDSKDKSLEYINDLLKDSRIKVVKNQTNLGQSKSLNVGLGLVESEFFMQLDADDLAATLPGTSSMYMKQKKEDN
ncbi:glycosyltransferase family 2 protein [Fictibacillus sp. KU28468]|uniref:glycosyltransferase family 2 protein n=1 Tax=Fictibacillus sp. KU28468 TaxID=2991053 RepID=UPI0039F6F17C